MTDDFNSRFVYPNGTLRNKLGIKDANELARIDYDHSANQATKILQSKKIKINSIDDLNKIHALMFGDLFTWAGKTRYYELSKHDHGFMPSAMLNQAATYINDELDQLPKGHCTKMQYAELLDSINEYHPFREGNGRSTKVFLQKLANQHNQTIDYPRHNKDLIKAQNDANVKALSQLLTVENLDNFTKEKTFEM